MQSIRPFRTKNWQIPCRSGGRRYHRADTNDHADQIPHQRPSETTRITTNAAPRANLASAPGRTSDADAARVPLPVGAWRRLAVHQPLSVPVAGSKATLTTEGNQFSTYG